METKTWILALLRKSWPYPMMVSQLMHQTGKSEEEVREAITALEGDGEDIVRTPEPGGASVREQLQYRWRQPILESQIAEGQTSADPAASSSPGTESSGRTTSSAESTRSSGPDKGAGPTFDT